MQGRSAPGRRRPCPGNERRVVPRRPGRAGTRRAALGMFPGLRREAGAATVGAWLAILVLSVTVSCAGPAPTAGTPASTKPPASLVVSAASDLTPVLEALVPIFREQTGVEVELNLGSTGQLAQQIAAGAPVDVFLAASTDAIDGLADKGLLVAGSERPYAVGRLVLWTAPGAPPVTTLADLRSAGVRRIALANPDHAPYGIAARQVLTQAGLWEELQPKLVLAENVRQAVQFAQSGNADVGLVALSLVLHADGRYELVPEELHEPLVQTLAIPETSTQQAEARRFIALLTGEEGRRLLEAYGFAIPGDGR